MKHVRWLAVGLICFAVVEGMAGVWDWRRFWQQIGRDVFPWTDCVRLNGCMLFDTLSASVQHLALGIGIWIFANVWTRHKFQMKNIQLRSSLELVVSGPSSTTE